MSTTTLPLGTDGMGLGFEEPAITFHSGMTEQEIYRLLPTAGNFEYGGVIEHDKIRYQRCAETMAWTEFSADCTWHSHPTGSSFCDQPSLLDIRSFLVNRNQRAVTAGRDIVGFRQTATDSTIHRATTQVGRVELGRENDPLDCYAARHSKLPSRIPLDSRICPMGQRKTVA